MLRGYPKVTSSLLFASFVSAVVILGLFSACRNPFSSDMGDKITVGRPTISNITPSSGDLLTGRERFEGQAWAHRELRRVEVRIGATTTGERFNDAGNPILDWTDISLLNGRISRTSVTYPAVGIEGAWHFYLDTLGLPETATARRTTMDDGRVMMRFRVWDNLGHIESDELSYNVKNLPSQITMAFPSDERVIEATEGHVGRIASGASIQGRITDLRGLAPGYPKIQIWPADRAEVTANPSGFEDDERYGLVSMFLTTLVPSGSSVNDDIEAGVYASRDGETVNVANFQFRLNSFTIAEEIRDDGVRAAIFPRDGDNKLPIAGEYLFRIVTRDTRGIVGHFPPYNHGTDREDRTSQGNPVAMFIINDATPPTIELFNTPQELAAPSPNIYVTSGINERIIALNNPSIARDVFQIRTLATHNSGISRAYLTWEHRATARSGELPLVKVPKTPGDQTEVFLTFTANESHSGIFTTQATPYVLTFRVYSDIGSFGERSFSLIMDGELPTVEIRPSIRGATAPPAGPVLPRHGGLVNESPITVNGNIQVSIDRTATPPIMFDGDRQRVKWFVEPMRAGREQVPETFSLDSPGEWEDSIFYRLVRFQHNRPSRENLDFFYDYLGFEYSSGRVSMPITTGTVPHDAYRTHNFKLDTGDYDGDYDGDYLWLYVVAMNQIHNLGFAMQKIRVDSSTDIPEINIPGFVFEGEGVIDGYEDLKVAVSITGNDPAAPGRSGNYPRHNVLSGDLGISIRVSDDDGIGRHVGDGITLTNYVLITLYDRHSGRSVVLNEAQLGFLQGTTPRAWSGTLSQEAMAAALRAAGATHIMANARQLPDGIYRFSMEVLDSDEFKVDIDGNTGLQRSSSKSFWFAVHNRNLNVEVETPDNNAFKSTDSVYIEGTVESPFRLQSLWISFYPDVLAADPDEPDYDDWVNRTGNYEMTFIDGNGDDNGNERFTVVRPATRGPDGVYVYRWQVRDVYFTTGPGDPGPERREFTLRAFDSMGFPNAEEENLASNWVRVDVEPPYVRFTGFNQNRPINRDINEFEVWGNVHFSVNVTDRHDLGYEPLPSGIVLPGERLSNVKWWLLPAAFDSDYLTWDTPFPTGAYGRGGRFLFRGDLNANLEAVFDSRTLANNAAYKLYVIARDAAGNEFRRRLNDRGVDIIRVNQAADAPELARFAPVSESVLRPDAAGNLRITGLARDTDGFNPARVNLAAPTDSHVQIQFYNNGWDDDGWIPVGGDLDATGAIDFGFYVFANHIRNSSIPGSGDGTVRYRLKISDKYETVAGRTRDKNPQIALGYTFLTTGSNALPAIPQIPLMSSAVSVFPADPGDYFSLILDTVAPDISFTDGIEQRTFQDIGYLRDALPGGSVADENLLFFDVGFGGRTFRLLDMPTGANHGWSWDMDVREVIAGILVSGTVNLNTELTNWFDGGNDGRRTISFVAEDRAGNRSPSMDWDFTRDRTPPTVGFSSFNQGRPVSLVEGTTNTMQFEVWGNVHFAVSVSDMHGIGSAALPSGVVLPPDVTLPADTRLADVRWWLLRDDVTPSSPSWDTQFPTGPYGAGGHFFARGDLSATFEAVFDSRHLTYNRDYRLYVIARDAAGNERRERMGGPTSRIRVNQNADRPILVGPSPDGIDRVEVLRPDTEDAIHITGLARDTDGFNPATVFVGNRYILATTYVEILFYNQGNGWGDAWLPVQGTLDATGAIEFQFDVMGLYPVPVDGTIRYRLRISDEDETTEGRTRSKNPQREVGHTFLTTDTAGIVRLPVIAQVGASIRYFPDTDYFSFILDDTPPVVELGYNENAPRVFGSFAAFMDVLDHGTVGGTVTEANLSFFDVSFGGRTFRLLDRPDGLNHYWNWNSNAHEVVAGEPVSGSVNLNTELANWFNGGSDGRRTVSFVAEDVAGNRSLSINWDFTRDFTPPIVSFTGFNQGRPVRPVDPSNLASGSVFEVWGNVHFAVSVSDAHGIRSADLPSGGPLPADTRLADVRWWLLPHDAPSPTWVTPFSGANQIGGHFLARGDLSATFEAVFSSADLADGYYKLYVIAIDVAGNEQMQRLGGNAGINRIRVNQAADAPDLVRFAPANNSVLRPENLRITGLARDTDGFNPATLPGSNILETTYVEILFFDYEYYDDHFGWNPDRWLPVQGTLDATGAIEFGFDVAATYDGPIRYRLRISDEPYATVGTRNKNPQIGNTFITTGNAPPVITPVGASTRVFPYNADYFSFILDRADPVIHFTDGSQTDTPIFGNVGDLISRLTGTVAEANLYFFNVAFGDTPPVNLPTTGQTHNWNLGSVTDALTAWFDGGNDGRRTISFVAEDMAGNRSPSINWDFIRDRTPPTVNFVSFNQGRPVSQVNSSSPVDPDNPASVHVFEAWGNVHFAISVADANGIGSVELPTSVTLPPGMILPDNVTADNRLADVRWWLLPHDATSPNWATPFNGANRTGGHFLARGDLSATFEAVFDSAALADGYYKLYVIARDVVGNYYRQRLNEGGISRIRVNQAADAPMLIGPAPANNAVLRDDNGSLFITGLARDTDGFNPATESDNSNILATTYVEILFFDYEYYDDHFGWNPDRWLPVQGTLDATGAIEFRFNVMEPDPARVDGTIRYRIRISDEHGTIEGKTRSKNPQMRGTNTVVTFYPFPSIPVRPAATETWEYVLILDRLPPVISNTLVGTQTTFNSVAGLTTTLQGGTVAEPNLYFFDVSFAGRTFRLLNIPTGVNHSWDWDTYVVQVIAGTPASATVNLLTELTSWFDNHETRQGEHTISFVAEDRAGNRSNTVNWSFTKDTEGPNLTLLGGMRRAILHNNQIADAAAPSGTRTIQPGDFPTDWPLDWPLAGGNWLTSWNAQWLAAIQDWPSDFAFIHGENHGQRVAAVIERINAERELSPFVFRPAIGGIGTMIGRFDDRHGYVWRDSPDNTTFEYRITRRGAAPAPNWTTSAPVTHNPDVDTYRRLTWSIYLHDEPGNDPLTDGEYLLDIRFSDNAGNETIVQGIRFFVDTEAPDFDSHESFRVRFDGMADDDYLELDDQVTEAWVFNAAAANPASDDKVFQVQGRVRDANLQQLAVTIGPGITAYAFTPLAPPPQDSGTPQDMRLSVEQYGTTDYWYWTLNVLERDIAVLRGPDDLDVVSNITLVATDVANQRTTVHWPFSLDSSAPHVDFNLESVVAPAANNGFTFRGTVQDDTGIAEMEFILARWIYDHLNVDNTRGAWRWFNGTDGFTAVTSEAGTWYDIPFAPGDRFVSWTVGEAELNAAEYGTFLVEGRYKIKIRASDGALSWGGAALAEGNSRDFYEEFFIDSGAPVIQWVAAERRFFNTNPGTANLWFDFSVSDPNTVPLDYFRAEIRNAAGVVVASTGDSPTVAADPELPVPTGSISIDWFGHATDTGDNSNEDWYTGPRSVRLRPGELPSAQYTLVLTVRDAAGNTTNVDHTRTFFIGNEAPRPIVDTPTNANAAVAGPVTIRGRGATPDGLGTGGIRSVEYLLIPSNIDLPAQPELDGTLADWRTWNAFFAEEFEVSDTDRGDWRTGAWNADVGGTSRQLMQMGAEAGANWEINIPNTRNILGSDYAATHAPLVDYDDRPGVTWGDSPNNQIGAAYDIHHMRLAIRSEDHAGNVGFTVRDVWLFPHGDMPVVQIWTPAVEDGEYSLMSGPFNIMGLASDNERVQDVFFRVLIRRTAYGDYTTVPAGGWHTIDGQQYRLARLSVPNFGGAGYQHNNSEITEPPGRQIPGREAYEGWGWYLADSTRTWQTDWSALINAYDELEPTAERGRNRIRIEVVATDAARLEPDFAPDDPNAGWDFSSPVIGRSVRYAYVVSGAPFIAQQEVTLSSGISGPPSLVHMGGGRATFRFTVLHEEGIGAIRYREVERHNIGTPTEPNWILRPTGSEISLLDGHAGSENDTARLNSHGFSVWAGVERTNVMHGTPPRAHVARYVYVQVDTLSPAFAAGGRYPMGANSAFWLPLQISTADNSTPNPNERRETLRLPIDNSPPSARHELNVWPAGSATLGGSASAGVGDPSGVPGVVDRVVVWFQTIARTEQVGDDTVTIPSEGVSWRRHALPGESDTAVGTFRWADATSSHPVSVTVSNGSGGTRAQNLPHIPDRNAPAGGNYAIVINRNNPFGSETQIEWGNASPDGLNSVATGWIPGGQGQIWNFTINTNRLPSGHLDMHFVAFDRAGNAFHDVQRITVMNGAPLIMDIQLATDLLGNDARQTDLNLGGTTMGVTGTNIFSTIRGLLGLGSTPTREQDIRGGIAPPELNPTAHGRSSAITGTRHHVDNFTVRNEFLALSVTTPPQHVSATRNFRVEYVSGARLFTGDYLRARLAERPGGVFVVQNSGGITTWQDVGANHATVSAGYAFLAAAEIPGNWGNTTVSAWELNDHITPNAASPLRLNIPVSPAPDAPLGALTREFAYGSNAFDAGAWAGTDAGGRRTNNLIVDHVPGAANLHERYSLFIIRVFDGAFGDLFTDFTLLSIRVNNNDRTAPFAQLHDLNPMSENLGRGDRAADNPPAGLAPAGIINTGDGQNRLRGGLWRDDSLGNLSRPGNIEPRYIASTSSSLYVTNRHSLTPTQMGGGDIDSAGFFERDTVSGRVVLRGYVEDDQRVSRVDLYIGGQTVTILQAATGSPTPAAGNTGLLAIPAAQTGRVFFYDTIDLFRHRVEWAFVWDTAAIPANTVVGDVTVRVIAYNANTDITPDTLGIRQSGLMTWENRAGSMETRTDRYNPNVRNPGFPTNVYRYNQITMNVRPYITGFRRNAALFFNNTRSMQGRYPFSRGETVVVTGFNLGRAGLTTAITLPGTVAATGVGAVSATQRDNFNLTSVDVARYQRFDIPATAGTGDGIVRLTVGGAENPAVNNIAARTNGVRHVQPWNIERSAAVVGSDLWDNRTSVHIWSSADDTTHRFPRAGNTILFGTDMSIDPRTGMLHSSHNSGTAHAATNESRTYRGTLGAGAQIAVTQFIDPIIQSSIFVSVDPDNTPRPWAVSSIIGRQGSDQVGARVGGIFLAGPGGLTASGMSNAGTTNNGFLIESIWHNASTDSLDNATPQASEQFRSPRVVTFHDGTDEHIHVVYWDSHTSAIKYRFNMRNQAIGTTDAVRQPWGLGTNEAGMNAAFNQTDGTAANFVRRLWTNLDGGFDMDDMRPAGAAVAAATQGTGARVWFDATFAATVAAQGSRVVGFPRGVSAADIPANSNTGGTPLRGTAIETGELSDIAVSSHGHPVVVYFDATNERLRMAVSNNRTPVAAAGWRIIPDVTVGDIRGQGAGRYVSMRIDTVRRYATGLATDNTDIATGNWNTVHISTFNANTNSLVYIRGRVNTNFGTSTNQADFWQFHHALVVDTLGTVGRRSTISLDADGNPWIAYYDQANMGSMDGVKVAFFNPAFTREHRDVYGNSLRGWEVMHVPARFRVSEGVDRGLRSSRIGIENFPTRNFPSDRLADGRAEFNWRAAVGFLSGDNQFRVAYWMP